MFRYREVIASDDARLAQIVRKNLERLHLNVPGTVYFDPELDHLSVLYGGKAPQSAYFVALDDDGQAAGGAGYAPFDGIESCAELQKLYLDDSVKGRGYGKELTKLVEEKVRAAGYKNLYLETHSNLTVAMSLYEKMGFHEIERPACVMHGTMDHFYLKKLDD